MQPRMSGESSPTSSSGQTTVPFPEDPDRPHPDFTKLRIQICPSGYRCILSMTRSFPSEESVGKDNYVFLANGKEPLGLHTPYHPQSSRKVGRLNGTLKDVENCPRDKQTMA
ncbi:unnamed protein product [Ranitomeya imitator]|uniref:Uncharacterized protein n=1 Tax=Ranitomeya imitator TaxID=111125 RepID=A0ABN9LA78_9NEOB|nr:unnamed protein product [Ranitomeya imitator]